MVTHILHFLPSRHVAKEERIFNPFFKQAFRQKTYLQKQNFSYRHTFSLPFSRIGAPSSRKKLFLNSSFFEGTILEERFVDFCRVSAIFLPHRWHRTRLLTLMRLGFLRLVFSGERVVNLTPASYFKNNLSNINLHAKINITLYNC